MADNIIHFPSGAIVTLFPVPSEDIYPVQLDEATRLRFGLPPRPIDADGSRRWEETMKRPVRLIEPVFRRMPDRVHGPLIRQTGSVPSEIWSGAVIRAPFGSTFAAASGRWTIPITNASEQNGKCEMSLWVGIDGAFTSPDVFQAGINAIAKNGQPTEYTAWWEWYPEFEVQIDNLGVAPGQAIDCQLAISSNKSGTIFLHNLSTGVAVTFEVTAPAGTTLIGDTAEWIAERPTVNGQKTRLADFGRATFVNVAASTHVGIAGMSPAVILGETSPVAPAIAALNGLLYLTWSGVQVTLISIACSTDDGRTFGHKFIVTETTSDAPALCAHNGNLILAWKGLDNPKLTIATVSVSGDTITGLTNKVILGETSPTSPTLASLNGRLYLAWRGVGNNLLSIACSTDNGLTFPHKFITGDTSSDAPSLCAHNGNLFLAWKGVDNPQLSVARVTLSGDSITGLSGKVILTETSVLGPAMASLNGRLFLSWHGFDNNQLSVAYSLNDGRSFGDKFMSTETSTDSPALCSHGNSLFASWKGVDNTKLSVAIVLI